jgi:hypothetical protein
VRLRGLARKLGLCFCRVRTGLLQEHLELTSQFLEKDTPCFKPLRKETLRSKVLEKNFVFQVIQERHFKFQLFQERHFRVPTFKSLKKDTSEPYERP